MLEKICIVLYFCCLFNCATVADLKPVLAEWNGYSKDQLVSIWGPPQAIRSFPQEQQLLIYRGYVPRLDTLDFLGKVLERGTQRPPETDSPEYMREPGKIYSSPSEDPVIPSLAYGPDYVKPKSQSSAESAPKATVKFYGCQIKVRTNKSGTILESFIEGDHDACVRVIRRNPFRDSNPASP